MRWWGLGIRRARARTGPLAAVAVVSAVVAASLLAIATATGSSVDRGVRQLVTDAAPEAAAVRITQPYDDDADARAEAVGEASGRLLPGMLSSDSVRTDDGDGGWAVLADDGLPAAAELTDGVWPDSADGAALQALAARRLGVEVGDRVALGDGDVEVTGLWRPIDAGDPRWFGETIVGSGAEDEWSGPLVVDRSRVADLGSPVLRSTLVALPSRLDAAVLPRLGSGLARLEAELRRTGIGNPDDIAVRSELPATIARATRAVAQAGGALAVPLVLIALTGGLLLGLLARTLAVARGPEGRLLRGRGAGGAAMLWFTALESAVVTVAGAVLGCGGAALVLLVLGTPPVPSVAIGIAAGTGLAAAGIVTIVAVVEAAAPPDGRAEGGRAALLAAVAPLLAAGVPAALAVVQFRTLGSSVVTGDDGVVRVDPVAVAAPALLLVALATAVPLLVVPTTALAERIAAAGRGLVPVLPLRQLARRSRAAAGAVLAVALGTAALTLAAAYDGTAARSATLDTAPVDVMVSADIRSAVDRTNAGVSGVAIEGLPGVRASATVLSVPTEIGGERVPIVAADPTAFAAVTGSRTLGPAADIGGVDLPDGARRLTLAVSLDVTGDLPPETSTDVAVWIADRLGGAVRREAGTLRVGESAVLEVPAESGRLLAIEASSATLPDTGVLEIGLGDVTIVGDDGTATDVDWQGSRSWSLRGSSPTVRVAALAEPPGPLPVVVTRAFATAFDARPGDSISVQLPAVRGATDSVIAAVVERLPGASGFAIGADLGAVVTRAVVAGGTVPAATVVWVAADDPRLAETSTRAALDRPSEVTTRAGTGAVPIVAVGVQWLWIGAVICALLAAVGFAIVGARTEPGRRSELRPLRSLGWTPAGQADGRALEVVAVAITGLLGGAGAGLLAARLTTPGLAGSSGTVVVDVLPAAAALLALGAVLLGSAAVAAIATRRVARTIGSGAA